MKLSSLLIALACCGCVQRQILPQALAAPQPGPAPAATAEPTPVPQYPQAKPIDERKPVKIKADKLRYNDRTKETEFSGHVLASQDTTTLRADLLRSKSQGATAHAQGHVLLQDFQRQVQIKAAEGDYTDSLGEATLGGGVQLNSQDPYAVPVTVTGQSAWYRSLSRLARIGGGVKVERGRILASAERAELNGEDNEVALLGDVDLKLGTRNQVHASRALLRGKGKSMAFQGAVEARLIPAEVKEASAHPER